MKLLILALCVLAVNAASPFNRQAFQGFDQFENVKPYRAVATAKASYEPTVLRTASVVKPDVIAVPVREVPVVKSVTNVVSNVRDAEAPVLRSESDVTLDGFNYVYETGNGISAQATGSRTNVKDSDALTVRGSYQYVAPDGTPVLVSYVADENGYQPQSDLLPVAPPVPAAIARSLEFIAAHPQPVEPVRIVKRAIFRY